MNLYKVSAILLGIANPVIAVALAISDWRYGPTFGGYTSYKNAMTAVTSLFIVGLLCLVLAFIFYVVMICQNIVPHGLVTARFVVLYLGVLSIMTGIIVFNFITRNLWDYFFVILGLVCTILTAILDTCTSQWVQHDTIAVSLPPES